MPIETFDIHELRRNAALRDEYEAFCAEKNVEASPHYANLFAIRKLGGGHKFFGMTERQITLFLAGGELPQGYD